MLVRQVTVQSGLPTHYASADEPTLRGADWVEQQWEATRLLVGSTPLLIQRADVETFLSKPAAHWLKA